MKRITAGVFAFALLLVGAALFAASESYVFKLRAEVVPPPEILTKTVVKDPSTVIVDGVPLDESKANQLIEKSLDPDKGLDVVFPCVPGETSPPKAHVKTCTYWVMRITIQNVFEELGFEGEVHMDDVLVKDIFSGEFLGLGLDNVPMEVLILKTPRGQTDKVHTGPSAANPWPKIELFWCVTGTLKVGNFDGDGVEEGQCNFPADPSEDQLRPGESATLEILVFTRLNPHGLALEPDDPRRGNFQEFTEPCPGDPKDLCYTLNSGARARWVDRKTPHPGQCHPLEDCPTTRPIMVGTSAFLNSLRLNTPIDFGTVFPGQKVVDQFEVFLGDSFLADGTDGTLTYRIEIVPGPAGNDISPYIKIVRDESEGPEDPDIVSYATLSEPNDISDLWFVKFQPPDCDGAHQKTPDADSVPCGVDGIDLGADVVISVIESIGDQLP